MEKKSVAAVYVQVQMCHFLNTCSMKTFLMGAHNSNSAWNSQFIFWETCNTFLQVNTLEEDLWSWWTVWTIKDFAHWSPHYLCDESNGTKTVWPKSSAFRMLRNLHHRPIANRLETSDLWGNGERDFPKWRKPSSLISCVWFVDSFEKSWWYDSIF